MDKQFPKARYCQDDHHSFIRHPEALWNPVPDGTICACGMVMKKGKGYELRKEEKENDL